MEAVSSGRVCVLLMPTGSGTTLTCLELLSPRTEFLPCLGPMGDLHPVCVAMNPGDHLLPRGPPKDCHRKPRSSKGLSQKAQVAMSTPNKPTPLFPQHPNSFSCTEGNSIGQVGSHKFNLRMIKCTENKWKILQRPKRDLLWPETQRVVFPSYLWSHFLQLPLPEANLSLKY